VLVQPFEPQPGRGQRVLHLQRHFGKDSLALAQRGAEVVGLDFSHSAIESARKLATVLGLMARTRFVEAEVFDAPAAVAEPATMRATTQIRMLGSRMRDSTIGSTP
jgi:hypothetical protein